MMCPLLSAGTLGASDGRAFARCDKRQCVWWCGDTCAVVMLGQAGRQLAEAVAEGRTGDLPASAPTSRG